MYTFRESDLLPPERRATATELAPLLVRIGAALLQFGCATRRVEACLLMTAACHGHPATVFAVPTGLWMSVGEDGAVQMARVDVAGVDLGHLADIDAIFNELASGRLSVDAGHDRLDALIAAPPLVGRLGMAVAGAAATGSTAVLFGGELTTVSLAIGLGVLMALCLPLLDRSPRVSPLTELAVGLVTGLASWLAVTVDPGVGRKPLILAGIILVVPGLTLTAGLSDLVERNLVAASARLMAALRTLVLLVFGVALAFRFEGALTGAQVAITDGDLAHGGWTLAVATLVGASAFAVFFSVARRDLLAAIVSGGLAWGSSLMAATYFGTSPMSAFLGALATGVFANAMARWTQRPAQIYLLSGIVMLVPGTLSFLSFEQLLAGSLSTGTAGAVGTLFSAGALAVGLVVANAALPSRKVL